MMSNPTVPLYLGVLVVTLAAGVTTATVGTDVRAALQTQKEVWVATRRANGTRSRAAPIWFWWDGRFLYFTTGPDTYKAKRIRKGSPVFVSVSGKEGPFFEGTAEIISDLQLVERLGTAYADKYWIAWFGLFRPRPARVSAGKTVAVRVTFR